MITDSPLAPAIRGRPISALVPKQQFKSQVATLYNDCRTHHKRCRLTRDSTFMPDRLLDVGQVKRDNVVRLIIVPEGFQSPYSTLSYCWGKAQSVHLTKDTLPRFCNQGIPTCDLPATIIDACETCASIGIRYIWVDSLCVMQDEEEDWSRQASLMNHIYNSSDLTISAAAGDNCNHGLFNKRSYASLLSAEIACETIAGFKGIGSIRGPLVSYGFKEPAQCRGWTMQECLLSRRLITFGTNQLSWECASSHWIESGAHFVATAPVDDYLPRPALAVSRSFDDNKPRQLRKENSELADIWQHLVKSFCLRQLTFERDKFPAISGLAQWLAPNFCRSMEIKYIAGLWEPHLPESLLWYHHLPFPVDLDDSRRPNAYRAPSWSWASLDCKYLRWTPATTRPCVAELLDSSVTLKSEDRYGEVLDGWLDIRAPIKQGWLVPSRTHCEHFDFWGADWRAELTDRRPTLSNKSLGWAELDFISSNEPCDGSLSEAEQRSKVCDCLRITEEAGILIEPADQPTSSGDSLQPRMRRLGIVIFKEELATSWWGDASKTIIRLV